MWNFKKQYFENQGIFFLVNYSIKNLKAFWHGSTIDKKLSSFKRLDDWSFDTIRGGLD